MGISLFSLDSSSWILCAYITAALVFFRLNSLLFLRLRCVCVSGDSAKYLSPAERIQLELRERKVMLVVVPCCAQFGLSMLFFFLKRCEPSLLARMVRRRRAG